MPSTINSDNGVVSGSAGVKTTADTSGVLALQSNGVTQLTVTSSGVTLATGGALVGATATQTLTNKTVEAGVFTNGYTEETAVANTSTAYTIDLANGSVQYLTLTGNCTYTFPTPVAGKSFTLIQKQDGTGGRTVTWPASVKCPVAQRQH